MKNEQQQLYGDDVCLPAAHNHVSQRSVFRMCHESEWKVSHMLHPSSFPEESCLWVDSAFTISEPVTVGQCAGCVTYKMADTLQLTREYYLLLPLKPTPPGPSVSKVSSSLSAIVVIHAWSTFPNPRCVSPPAISTPLFPMGAIITQLALSGSTSANSVRPAQHQMLQRQAVRTQVDAQEWMLSSF
jgi:hypothetical protein